MTDFILLEIVFTRLCKKIPFCNKRSIVVRHYIIVSAIMHPKVNLLGKRRASGVKPVPNQ